jgi:hypothetical protein
MGSYAVASARKLRKLAGSMNKAVPAMDRASAGDCIGGRIPFVCQEYVARIAGAHGP